MTGCILIWSALASSTPPIINENIKVTKIGKDWMVLKLTYNPVRNCKTEEFSTIFIFGNNRIELPAVFITSGDDKTQDNKLIRKKFAYIGVVNTTGLIPDQFFIYATHECALGFQFSTEFPIEDVPKAFTEEGTAVVPRLPEPPQKQSEGISGV